MDCYIDVVELSICIICNSDEGAVSILADTLEGEGVLLHEALEFITCIKADTGDSIDKALCEACNARLLDAYRFKIQALESYIDMVDKFVYKHDIKLQANELVLDTIDSVPKISSPLARSTVRPEIDTSTDAVSFLIEYHSSNKTKDKPEVEQKTVESPEPTENKVNRIITNSIVKLKHECKVCGKLFRKKSNFLDHMRLHTNEKKFVCTYCDKGFVQIANFRMHQRTHTKERPFVCPVCSKAYTQSSSLKVHIRSHTQERNFVCQICGKDFTNSSDLNKHKRLHDPSKHLNCEFCGKVFVQKINLKVHQKNVHKQRIS